MRNASTAMHLVGVVEIIAGITVALKPRYGAYIVAAWLAGIIVDLLTYSGYYDVALRDFGLLVGALARLASRYDPPGWRPLSRSTASRWDRPGACPPRRAFRARN